MSLKLISFTIADASKFSECVKEITAEPHLKLNEQTYLLETSKHIDILRRELAYYLDKPDELFICKLRAGEWISFHLGAKKKWIDERV
ncbi:MAG: hypothetical protein ABI778_03320 [Ignavibacteriota bacterium]